MVAGVALLVAMWVFLLHSVHPGLVIVVEWRTAVLREFGPITVVALAFLLAFGLLGGWILSGRMLAPLTRITDAARTATTGSLSHRIRLPGRSDEFRDGSSALLVQLATNLVHNAIVHNVPARGTVWVHTGVHPRSVVLTVENTGEKLTPQLVSTLTEPFQRGTARVHTDHAGVGLGLAIAKTITRAHDGTLTLIPRPPAGSASPWNCPPHRGRTAGDPDTRPLGRVMSVHRGGRKPFDQRDGRGLACGH